MRTKKIVLVSILTALSIILSITIYFPILPQAPYLLYDPGDIPLLLISTKIGVVDSVLSTLIVSILMALFTGQGGPIGALMHFLATGTLVTVAGLIYRRTKNLIISLISGTISMAGIMVIANIIFTPIYLGVPRSTIYPLLLPVIVPFNLIKAGLNSMITYILLSISTLSQYFEKMKE